jgi:hypothetical protein
MNEFDDLEVQQYERQFWDDDVPLHDVRKSVLRKFIWWGALLFLVLMVMGALLKFPDQVQLPFVFKASKSEEVYRFPFTVYVTENKLQPGMSVKKGDPLMRITCPEIVQLINAYREAEMNLADYQSKKVFSGVKAQQIVRLRMEQTRQKLAQLNQQLDALEQTWQSNQQQLEYEQKDAEQKLKANRELHEQKYISTDELRALESRSIKTRDAVLTQKQQYQASKSGILSERYQYETELLSLQQEIDKQQLDRGFDTISLTHTVDRSRQQITQLFGESEIEDGSIVIKAAADGKVTHVFEGEKEVQSGAILVKLRYQLSALYASVITPSTIIGKLKAGQPVFLKVATFPSYEYGAVHGHIHQVSMTPDENGNFHTYIQIDDMRQLKGKLEPGMNGEASIVIDEKSFFQYFFRAIRKTYADITMN